MQISLFDGKHKYRISKPVRLIELFAGIGSQAKALEKLNIDFEHYRVCEFDKFAIQSYNAIHGTDFTISDITELKGESLGIVSTDKYDYIMTYSFPCQDLSVAGKNAGMTRGDNTRSGLLWEVERLLNETVEKPQVLVMENVKQVLSTKNISDFNEWITFLEKQGYKNYYKILNSKDYGIPQNRERCFMVSILGNYYYSFPKTQKIEKRLVDILEHTVDKKYYLSEIQDHKVVNKTISKTVRASGHGSVDRHSWDLVFAPVMGAIRGRYIDNGKKKTAQTLELNTQGTTNALTTVQKDNVVCEPKLQLVGNIAGKHEQTTKVYDPIGISPTLTTMQGGNQEPKIMEKGVRVRKLIPLECWRLMGFSDDDFNKAKLAGVSDSQLYKQAGNSIVVNVLVELFRELL